MSLALLLLVPLSASLSAQRTITAPAEDRPLDSSWEESFRVGGSAAEAWAALQRVNHVAFDGEGRLYILDALAPHVLVIDGEGALVRTLGRRGDGPGEFNSANTLTVTEDGTVAVYDFQRRAFALFGPDGRYLRQVAVDVEQGIPANHSLSDPTGVGVVAPPIGLQYGSIGLADTGGIPIRRFDLTGTAARIETLYRGSRLAKEYDGGPRDMAELGQGGFRSYVLDFHYGAFPDGRVAVVDDYAYRIELVNPLSGERTVIERSIPPIELTRDLREEEKERWRERFSDPTPAGSATMSGGSSEAEEDAPRRRLSSNEQDRIENMIFPEVAQIVSGLRIDREGRMWVRRRNADATEEGPIDLYDPEGGYLGTLTGEAARLPYAFGPNGEAAFLERDEFDAVVVVVRRFDIEGG